MSILTDTKHFEAKTAMHIQTHFTASTIGSDSDSDDPVLLTRITPIPCASSTNLIYPHLPMNVRTTQTFGVRGHDAPPPSYHEAVITSNQPPPYPATVIPVPPVPVFNSTTNRCDHSRTSFYLYDYDSYMMACILILCIEFFPLGLLAMFAIESAKIFRCFHCGHSKRTNTCYFYVMFFILQLIIIGLIILGFIFGICPVNETHQQSWTCWQSPPQKGQGIHTMQ